MTDETKSEANETDEKADLAAIVEELRGESFTIRTAYLGAQLLTVLSDYRKALIAEMVAAGGFDGEDIAFADAVAPLLNLVTLSSLKRIAENSMRVSMLEGRCPFNAPSTEAGIQTTFDDLAEIGREHAEIILSESAFQAIIARVQAKE